jgi:hypothetical protein
MKVGMIASSIGITSRTDATQSSACVQLANPSLFLNQSGYLVNKPEVDLEVDDGEYADTNLSLTTINVAVSQDTLAMYAPF